MNKSKFLPSLLALAFSQLLSAHGLQEGFCYQYQNSASDELIEIFKSTDGQYQIFVGSTAFGMGGPYVAGHRYVFPIETEDSDNVTLKTCDEPRCDLLVRISIEQDFETELLLTSNDYWPRGQLLKTRHTFIQKVPSNRVTRIQSGDFMLVGSCIEKTAQLDD